MAKEDEILRSVMVDRLGVVTAEEYDEEFDDIIDEARNGRGDENGVILLNTYIDATGCIRGVSFEGTGDYDGKAKLILGGEGNEYRGEFYVGDSEKDEINCVLRATENDGRVSGVLEVTYDEGEEIRVELNDFEVVNDRFVNGTATFVLPEDSGVDMISVAVNSDGATQTVTLPLNIDGEDYGRLILSVSDEKGADPILPDKSAAFIVNEDSEISDYVEREKMEKFITDILERYGLSPEDSEDTAEYIVDDMYDTYEYEYEYDWDDDDFEFDWDDDDFEFDWDEEIEPERVDEPELKFS